jgi:hypothetical protein
VQPSILMSRSAASDTLLSLMTECQIELSSLAFLPPHVLSVDVSMGSQGMAFPLLLYGLEVGDEYLDVAANDGLAEHVMPHDLPKTLAPDRHVPTAMG